MKIKVSAKPWQPAVNRADESKGNVVSEILSCQQILNPHTHTLIVHVCTCIDTVKNSDCAKTAFTSYVYDFEMVLVREFLPFECVAKDRLETIKLFIK